MGHGAGEGFYADIINMKASVEELIRMTRSIVADVDYLNQIANASKLTWSGEARDTFDTESVIWNDACKDMTDKLGIATNVLDGFTLNYLNSDAKSTSEFDGSGRP